MNLIERHISINNNILLSGINIELIKAYNESLLNYNINPDDFKEVILNKIRNYINIQYENIVDIIEINQRICKDNVDLNYYLEKIIIISKEKFNDIINKLNIDHLIGIIDYKKLLNNKNYYKFLSKEYHKLFYDKIINGQYKLDGIIKNMQELIDTKWSTIKFNNIINYTQIVNRYKFIIDKEDSLNIELYRNMINRKFDENENIRKLVDYIKETFVDNNDYKFNDINFDNFEDTNEKFNFRFIIDNLKSNGYLLFEEYFKQLKNKHIQKITLDIIQKDKKIVNYFMYIILQRDNNNVNRYVNELLIKMRDYLNDLHNSYNNIIIFRKMQIKKESNKYNEFDLSKYNRNILNYTILKYNNITDEQIKNYKLPQDINLDFDAYKSFYKIKYPDREIEYDILNSTIIIKLNMNKVYYINMSLVQYIILEKIYNYKTAISIVDLIKETNIPIDYVESVINSLLKIKLIKRSECDNIKELSLIMNNDFENENTKISINLLIEKNKEEKNKSFMHDRNTIVLCNILDYAKKNKIIFVDVLKDKLQYQIPFKLDLEIITKGLNDAVIKNYIKKIDSHTNNGIDRIETLYQYIE